MASGRPIVTNRSGDAWKIIEENRAGLVAKVDDQEDFAQKIVEILKDPRKASQFSKNGRKAAEEKCSWEIITRSLVKDVYEGN